MERTDTRHLGTGIGLTECQLPGCWCHVAFVECKGKLANNKPCKAINHGYRLKCWNCEGEFKDVKSS